MAKSIVTLPECRTACGSDDPGKHPANAVPRIKLNKNRGFYRLIVQLAAASSAAAAEVAV
jgi:hypothetical protein